MVLSGKSFINSPLAILSAGFCPIIHGCNVDLLLSVAAARGLPYIDLLSVSPRREVSYLSFRLSGYSYISVHGEPFTPSMESTLNIFWNEFCAWAHQKHHNTFSLYTGFGYSVLIQAPEMLILMREFFSLKSAAITDAANALFLQPTPKRKYISATKIMCDFSIEEFKDHRSFLNDAAGALWECGYSFPESNMRAGGFFDAGRSFTPAIPQSDLAGRFSLEDEDGLLFAAFQELIGYDLAGFVVHPIDSQ